MIGGLGTKSPRSKNVLVIKVQIQAVFVYFIIQKIYQWFVSLSVKKNFAHRLGAWPSVAPLDPPLFGMVSNWQSDSFSGQKQY